MHKLSINLFFSVGIESIEKIESCDIVIIKNTII